MQANGIATEMLRPVDFDFAAGRLSRHDAAWISSATNGHNFVARCSDADILGRRHADLVGRRKFRFCRRLIERLYGESGNLNEQGQYVYYGRGGRLHRNRQRRWRQALCDVGFVRAATFGLCHPAAGRCRLDRRSPGRGHRMPTKIPAGRKTISRNATPLS